MSEAAHEGMDFNPFPLGDTGLKSTKNNGLV